MRRPRECAGDSPGHCTSRDNALFRRLGIKPSGFVLIKHNLRQSTFAFRDRLQSVSWDNALGAKGGRIKMSCSLHAELGMSLFRSKYGQKLPKSGRKFCQGLNFGHINAWGRGSGGREKVTGLYPKVLVCGDFSRDDGPKHISKPTWPEKFRDWLSEIAGLCEVIQLPNNLCTLRTSPTRRLHKDEQKKSGAVNPVSTKLPDGGMQIERTQDRYRERERERERS